MRRFSGEISISVLSVTWILPEEIGMYWFCEKTFFWSWIVEYSIVVVVFCGDVFTTKDKELLWSNSVCKSFDSSDCSSWSSLLSKEVSFSFCQSPAFRFLRPFHWVPLQFFWCRWRCFDCLYVEPQCSHANGRASEWDILCVLRPVAVAVLNPHCSHWYGFSPVCFRKWAKRSYLNA